VSFISRASGATIFDISPKTLSNLKGIEAIQAVQQTFKICKSMPTPCLIVIQDVDLVYAKKSQPILSTSGGAALDPRTLKRDLGKLMKGLKPVEDGVMVLGLCSSKVNECDPPTLSSAFDLTIWKEWPNYADRYSVISQGINPAIPNAEKDGIASIVAAMASESNSAGLSDITRQFMNRTTGSALKDFARSKFETQTPGASNEKQDSEVIFKTNNLNLSNVDLG
jgi:hypothetical protein